MLVFLPELPEIDLPQRTETEKIRWSVVVLWKTNHVESLLPNDQIDLKSFVLGRTSYHWCFFSPKSRPDICFCFFTSSWMLLSDIDIIIISYSDWHWILTNSGQLNLRLTQGMLGLFVGIENHRNVMNICWSHRFCHKLSDHTRQTRGTFSCGRTTAETQDVEAEWASWMFPRWNRVFPYFAGQQSELQLIICIDAWLTVECFGTSPKCETSCGGKQINMANWVLSVVGIGARSPACSKKHQSILFIWADGGESLARLEFEQRHWKVPRFQSFSLPSSSKPRCQPILENRALWSCTTCGYTRAPMWWDSDKFRLLSQVEGDLIQAWKILRCFAKNNACCMLLDSSVRLGGSKPWLKPDR